jgi:hypothetical protein
MSNDEEIEVRLIPIIDAQILRRSRNLPATASFK